MCWCCTPQNQQASWVDGSEWSYSDWMPGHPNIHTEKPVCVEMFKIGKNTPQTHTLIIYVYIFWKTSVSGRHVSLNKKIAHLLSLK